MVELSFNDHVAIASFLHTKSSSDCERIISIIDDATADDLPRKAASQGSEVPFAAENL